MQSHNRSKPNDRTAPRARGRQGQPAARGRDVVARRRPWPWLVLLALVLLAGGALAVTMRGGDRPNGKLIAEHTAHDFGTVPIHGGLVVARFPLAVQGATLVTDLGTS